MHVSSLALQNRVAEAATGIPEAADALIRRLLECPSAEDAAGVFDSVLLEMRQNATALDKEVMAGVVALMASQGRERISAIARQVALSEMMIMPG